MAGQSAARAGRVIDLMALALSWRLLLSNKLSDKPVFDARTLLHCLKMMEGMLSTTRRRVNGPHGSIRKRVRFHECYYMRTLLVSRVFHSVTAMRSSVKWCFTASKTTSLWKTHPYRNWRSFSCFCDDDIYDHIWHQGMHQSEKSRRLHFLCQWVENGLPILAFCWEIGKI